VLEHLALGFSVALEPMHLLMLVLGVMAGTLVGAMPGLGPSGAIAILLPVAYGMDPASLIILMAAVYYGAFYGNSSVAILLNIPGDAASVMTTLDGHQLAKKGRAGPALAISAVSSFAAGTAAVVLLMVFADAVSVWALEFGPVEYFGLLVFGLSTVAALTGRSLIKGLLSLMFGLMLATVGIDPITGYDRFTWGSLWLADGIPFVVVAMGLFAVPQVLDTVRQMFGTEGTPVRLPLGRVWIKWRELKSCLPAMSRGGVTGFLVGVLPGAGATIATFLAYTLEKKFARHPERYGTGDLRGVAAPEAANNAASGGSMIPLITLGVPGSAATAMMLAALMIGGVTPGPGMIEKHPDVFWGLVASMYMGNVMLLVVNFPLIPLWVRVLDVHPKYLLPLVLIIPVIGVYAIKQSAVDLVLLAVFGAVGFYMRSRDYPIAPVLLGLVLGTLMEQSMRRALIISNGDISIFFENNICMIFLILSVAFLIGPSITRIILQGFQRSANR